MYDFCLKGVLNQDVNSVYNAFSDPQVIRKWFAPGKLIVSYFSSAFQVGGHYQAVLQSPDGFQQTIVGSYQEIKPKEHISFTWRWDDTNDISKVDIRFAAMRNESSSLTIVQSGFAKEQDMLQQQNAWLGCLEKLSLVLKEQTQMTNTIDTRFTYESLSQSV
jgi:uncharacterized protein YndB with AHSA1/START domain